MRFPDRPSSRLRPILKGLLALVPLAGASGCSSTRLAVGQPRVLPGIKTTATIGDRPVSVVAGVTGESVGGPTDPPDRADRPGGRITGQVVDDRGRPVPEAEVRLADGGPTTGRALRARTDAAGRFTLRDLRPGSRYTLIAESGSGRSARVGRAVARAPEGDVTIEVGHEEPSSDDGEPVGAADRMERVSGRRDTRPYDEPDARPARLNPDDLPPAPEAQAYEPAESDRVRITRGTSSRTRGGWRPAAPESLDSTEGPEPQDAEPPPSPIARRSPLGLPIEDEDGPNPLPPALERSRTDDRPSLPDPMDEGPVDPRMPAPRTAPELEPAPAAGPSPTVPPPGPPTSWEDAVGDLDEPDEPPTPGLMTPAPPGEQPSSDAPQEPGPMSVVATPSTPFVDAAGPEPTPGLEPGPDLTPGPPGLNESVAMPSGPDEPPSAQPPEFEEPPPTDPESTTAPGPAELEESPGDPPPPATEPEPSSVFVAGPATPDDEAAPPSTEAEAIDPESTQPVGSFEHPPATAEDRETDLVADVEPMPRPTWKDLTSQSSARRATEYPPSMRRDRVSPVTSDASSGLLASANEPARRGRFGLGTLASLRGKDESAGGEAATTALTPSCKYDERSGRLVRLIDFTLPDVQGRPVRFQDLDADYILLDFWGTWCGPCLKSVPHLVQLQNRYDIKRLRVVGVAYEQAEAGQGAALVARAMSDLGINYPVLVGESDGRPCPLAHALKVQAYPTLVLLDRHGRVLWRDSGASPSTLARLDRVVAANARAGTVRR